MGEASVEVIKSVQENPEREEKNGKKKRKSWKESFVITNGERAGLLRREGKTVEMNSSGKS